MSPDAPLPVLLDTDLGDDIDDAYALGVCLRHPGVQLVGVSTVLGDTELRAAQTRYLLALEGRSEIPVAAGSRDPLDSLAPLGRNCQAAVLPAHEEERWRAGRHDGVRALAEWSASHPGAVLLAIGPLTNVGRFVSEFPEEFALLSRLVIMGGHMQAGIDYPEWNFRCDPRAARIVLTAGKPVLLVGLDVTLQCRMIREDLERIGAARTPLSAALSAMTRMWQEHAKGETPPLPTLHDPLATLAMVEPQVLHTETRGVEVDAYGNCLPAAGPPNVEFSVGVQARKAVERVVGLVA